MAGFEEFQEFKNFKTVDKKDLELVTNYICLQLNSGSSFQYKYYYDMYSYCHKVPYDFAAKNLHKAR